MMAAPHLGSPENAIIKFPYLRLQLDFVLGRLRRVLNLNELTLRFIDELNLYSLGLQSVCLLFSLGCQHPLPLQAQTYTRKK